MQANIMDSNPAELGYEWFQDKIINISGLNLTHYKRPQMERRIRHLMDRVGVKSFLEYLKLLETNQDSLRQFIDWVTINVSEFFRDIDRYDALANKILPDLVQNFKRLKIWSAGCSNGAEPYSIAILLKELGFKNHTIIATDLDLGSLAKAKEGVYKKNDVKNLSSDILEKYFTSYTNEKGEILYKLSEEIKKDVAFKKHNLFTDIFEHNCDLIACRNVVIYFTTEAKDHLYNKFANSLSIGGVFFVGSTESLLNSRNFGFERIDIGFYRKI